MAIGDDVGVIVEGGGERRSRHWHVDKRVSIGHLLTTLSIVVAALVWGFKQETRISVLERTFELQMQSTQQQLADIKSTLARVEEKLDRRR